MKRSPEIQRNKPVHRSDVALMLGLLLATVVASVLDGQILWFLLVAGAVSSVELLFRYQRTRSGGPERRPEPGDSGTAERN